MKLDLPTNLYSLVSRKFADAKATQDLIFSSTELAIIHTRRKAPFQLRYCPALAKKPTASQPQDAAKSKPKDPFENIPQGLLLAEFPKNDVSHILVLNKYPVIANHFILATKQTKPQTDILELDDLDATYSCLKAWEESRIESSPLRLFAFFNSGEHSGASQAHRHLQFLPVQEMAGMRSQSGWVLLVDRMIEQVPGRPELLQDTSLPFCHYATKIPPEPSRARLHQLYLMLYRSAVNAVRDIKDDATAESPEDIAPALDVDGEAAISYNLAITTEMMAICPRRAEAAKVPSETADGLVAINGTILAGTLMVKDQGEWQSLREDESLLDGLLASIGVPAARSSTDLKVGSSERSELSG